MSNTDRKETKKAKDGCEEKVNCCLVSIRAFLAPVSSCIPMTPAGVQNTTARNYKGERDNFLNLLLSLSLFLCYTSFVSQQSSIYLSLSLSLNVVSLSFVVILPLSVNFNSYQTNTSCSNCLQFLLSSCYSQLTYLDFCPSYLFYFLSLYLTHFIPLSPFSSLKTCL